MAITSTRVTDSVLDVVLAAAQSVEDPDAGFGPMLPPELPEPGEPFRYESLEAIILADPRDGVGAIAGVGLAYGFGYEPDDPDDPDLDAFPQRDLGPDWILNRDAEADDLTTIWSGVRDMVEQRLGRPAYDEVEDDEENWRRAVWLLGPSLVCVGIGEDPGSYSLYNRAHLSIVRAPDGLTAEEIDEELLEERFGV